VEETTAIHGRDHHCIDGRGSGRVRAAHAPYAADVLYRGARSKPRLNSRKKPLFSS